MPDWDARYVEDDLPWDTGEPEPQLVELVERGVITPGRALEVGCGTGTNSLYLAARGFDVLGVDIAANAITRARAEAEAAGASARFEVLDFLTASLDEGGFDFVFDRAVLHVFDDAVSRARFVSQVSRVLEPGARWLSIAGSTEGPPRDYGPPRRTARELIEAIEPELELVELCAVDFFNGTAGWWAWRILSRVREVPAQPSTRRDA